MKKIVFSILFASSIFAVQAQQKTVVAPVKKTTPTTQPSVPPTLSTPGSSTTYSILDYIFQFSYITCFLAAVLLSISQLTGWDFIQLTLNDSLTNYIYIYVGICSIVALFSWFNTSIWYIDTSIVNPSNVAASKSKISF